MHTITRLKFSIPKANDYCEAEWHSPAQNLESDQELRFVSFHLPRRPGNTDIFKLQGAHIMQSDHRASGHLGVNFRCLEKRPWP